ncbi:hypothetical protein AHAS_Ahas04G0019100 [Arachis hypogaea]
MMIAATTMETESLMRGDKLILMGLMFHGFHGVNPEERTLGQKLLEVIQGPPHNLLESVAQKIVSTTLTNHHQISAVRVLVGKPHVAVIGPVDYLGVEVHRFRSDVAN